MTLDRLLRACVLIASALTLIVGLILVWPVFSAGRPVAPDAGVAMLCVTLSLMGLRSTL